MCVAKSRKVSLKFASVKPTILKIYTSIKSFHAEKQTIATIGTFDGVHIGHKKIIEKLTQNATNLDCESLILTFFPHPRMILKGNSDVLLLNTLDEKKELLEWVGLDHLIIHPFDAEFSQLEAADFVKSVLVDQFNIKKIIIGHDHRFGKNRSANIDDLILYGEKYGFEVEQIPVQEINAVSVSSTKIRNAILDGDMTLANNYLGYGYFLTGTVVKGKQLGRTIGFPTANIKINEDYKLIPKIGVYAVTSTIDNELVFGMMNIGTNPTVGGQHLSIEVNFFDLDIDLYDKTLRISILQRIRDEHKFESVQILKEQLGMDKLSAIAYFKRKY